ncbi:MAG: glycosyltransferase family 9 protein, partial [Betaproteobacteria bacterium]
MHGWRNLRGRKPPTQPRRILIAHHLLIGDTLMLTPLLAKLRERFPPAEIVLTVPVAIAPLYENQPYGVTVWPFDPRDPETMRFMFARRGFDLAFIPGDNRYSWLAHALGSRWIVAHEGEPGRYKSWPVDQLVAYPAFAAAWGDIVAGLVEGPAPAPYRTTDWRAPSSAPFELPVRPYAVLHLGASHPLKLWGAEKWQGLTRHLSGRGFEVVLSAGPGQDALIGEVDPDKKFTAFAGSLNLSQLWRLLEHSMVLVCPDTGVAHLGRVVGTPTVTLFGPGSAEAYGAGDFWRDAPYRALTLDDFPCRDQPLMFNRKIEWVRRCERTT